MREQRYELQRWLQVGLIVGGVVVVSLGKEKAKGGDASSSQSLGLACLTLSLVCDGEKGTVLKCFEGRKGVRIVTSAEPPSSLLPTAGITGGTQDNMNAAYAAATEKALGQKKKLQP